MLVLSLAVAFKLRSWVMVRVNLSYFSLASFLMENKVFGINKIYSPR